MEVVTPQLEEVIKKVMRDALERVLDNSTPIQGKVDDIRLIYDFIGRKRLDLHNATRKSKYSRYYNGWKYVDYHPKPVRKRSVRN